MDMAAGSRNLGEKVKVLGLHEKTRSDDCYSCCMLLIYLRSLDHFHFFRGVGGHSFPDICSHIYCAPVE